MPDLPRVARSLSTLRFQNAEDPDVNPDDTVFGLMNRACPDQGVRLSEEYPRKHTLAELRSLCGPIRLVNHHSEWPARARQIRGISPLE